MLHVMHQLPKIIKIPKQSKEKLPKKIESYDPMDLHREIQICFSLAATDSNLFEILNPE